MGYLARNISGGYAMLLKQQVPPGGTIDLEDVFLGFCKPKKSARAEVAKYAEFGEHQFDEFLEWVNEMVDRRFWIVESGDGEPVAIQSSGVTRKATRRRQSLTEKKIQRALSASELTPKQISLLPFAETTKKTIKDCSDVRKLKLALKLVKNLAGQERVRTLLEDRVNELATAGIS